jgi:hypothetical protein
MVLLYRVLFVLIGICWLCSGVNAQTPTPPKSVFQTLTETEFSKITLEVDLTTLLANRKKNDYIPATLSTSDGKKWSVEVKTRGKYRRKICEIPPLKIKFSKKALKSQGLDTLNEVKLSIPCFENDKGDELVVKEYLAYRMFEHLTEACVKARLIKLKLVDSHVGKSYTLVSMMIEDEEETNARLNGSIVEEYGLPVDSFLINQAALVSVFEFMIGNTDWDVSMIRNVRTIRSKENGKVLLIPYDFDFSGFVSAPYASPSSDSGLKTVRERFLIHNGIPQEHLKKAANRLLLSRKDLTTICRSKYLDRETAQGLVDFLDSFFDKVRATENLPTMISAPPTE